MVPNYVNAIPGELHSDRLNILAFRYLPNNNVTVVIGMGNLGNFPLSNLQITATTTDVLYSMANGVTNAK